MIKTFSKQKYIEAEWYRKYLLNKQWVDCCDGRQVIPTSKYNIVFSVVGRHRLASYKWVEDKLN